MGSVYAGSRKRWEWCFAGRVKHHMREFAMRNTVVRRSPTHGKGLFAARDFQAGENVENIEGEIVLGVRKSKYAIHLSGRRSLLLTNKTKYVNHGNPHNVVFNLRKQTLVAVATIRKGEEV